MLSLTSALERERERDECPYSKAKDYSLSEVKYNITVRCNLLKTKRNLLYIRHQSVPRCEHFPARL